MFHQEESTRRHSGWDGQFLGGFRWLDGVDSFEGGGFGGSVLRVLKSFEGCFGCFDS